MQLQIIEVESFRNVHGQSVEFSPGATLFYGNNAQGKTNLLEAVYLLAAGKSFRCRRLKEMIPTGESFFRIAAEVSEKERSQALAMAYSEKDGKKLWINKRETNDEREFFTHLNIVHFSPDSLSLVKGSPDQRREFLDFAIAQLRPRYHLIRKECARLLLQRNAQLKYIVKTGLGRDMMSVWDSYVSKLFAKMTVYRRGYVSLLKDIAAAQYETVSDQCENLKMKYLSSAPDEITDEKELSDFFQNSLSENLEEDIRNQSTGIGPHRDDLLLFIGGHNAKTFASQGQQRAAVLALKLAEGDIFTKDRGFSPLYLLDDIFSELDENRRRHLLIALENKQSILTTCEIATTPFDIFGKRYRVENGIYTEEK